MCFVLSAKKNKEWQDNRVNRVTVCVTAGVTMAKYEIVFESQETELDDLRDAAKVFLSKVPHSKLISVLRIVESEDELIRLMTDNG